MRFFAMIAIGALALGAVGCGEETSDWEQSSCAYDDWCDSEGCHTLEVCEFESCTESWDQDFGDEVYVERCTRGRRTTEEVESRDGSVHTRRVAEVGDTCSYVQRADAWDYEESFYCEDYRDEESWRTECGAAGCTTRHCVNGVCDWS